MPPLIDLAVGLLCLAVVMAVYGTAPTPAIVTAPAWLAATVLFALGVGAAFAALQVRYRDVGHALGLTTQLWFFATPVVYASSSIDGVARAVLALNPLTGLVDGMRWALIGGPAPPIVDLLSLATGTFLVIVGIVVFQRLERSIADVI